MKSDEDLTEATGRLIRALGRRCAAGDPDTWSLLRVLRCDLLDAEYQAVAGWRAHDFTDGQIAAEMGITRQAVSKRWPR